MLSPHLTSSACKAARVPRPPARLADLYWYSTQHLPRIVRELIEGCVCLCGGRRVFIIARQCPRCSAPLVPDFALVSAATVAGCLQ